MQQLSIDYSVEVPCKIALDFEALIYDKWKSQNYYRLQALPLCTSPRQCRHAQTFNGLQPQERVRNSPGFLQYLTGQKGIKSTASLPRCPPQRPLPPTPQQQKVTESLPRLHAVPHEEGNSYEEILENFDGSSTQPEESRTKTKEGMTHHNVTPLSPTKTRITTILEDGKTTGSYKLSELGSDDFQKFLWTPEAEHVHLPLQTLRPFVTVHVPLLYRFAPSADKWLRYQPETDSSQQNHWRGTALWYMPTEWINQCPKEPAPNAIFGMCPKSLCSGKAPEVYHFKNYLYCDHGFTDNEDAHRGLNFQFTSCLPKDSRKAKERIVNYFPVTVTNPCYKIQDSAKTYCPKAV